MNPPCEILRIAVPARHYYPGRIGGQENYLLAMVAGLAGRGHRLTIFAPEAAVAALRGAGGPAVEIAALPGAGRPMWAAVSGGGFDVLYCPLHTLDPLEPPIPSVVMIPDIQHEYFPGNFDGKELVRRRRSYEPSARRAQVVLTCSEYSKRTIVERYQVPAERVVVCGHGVGTRFQEAQGVAGLVLPRDYLYLPAVYWPHKNHVTALRALAALRARGWLELHLVCSGGDGPEREKVLRLVAELGLADRVQLLGRVGDALVPELYRRSRGLLFPSLFEGFGIPVLEALQLGVPVVTARGGAAEEVAGGCAVLVDALDPEAVADGVERILTDDGMRAGWMAAGRVRAAEFSWARAVAVTEEALRRAACEGSPAPAAVGVEVEEWPSISVVARRGADLAMVRQQGYSKLEIVESEDVREGYSRCGGVLVHVLRPGARWMEGTARLVAEVWRRNPRVGLVYGLTRVGDELVGRVPFLYEDMNEGPLFTGAAAFVRREAVRVAPELKAPLDEWSLWLKVAEEWAVEGLAECLAEWAGAKAEVDAELERQALELVRAAFGFVPEHWLDGRAWVALGGQARRRGRWARLWRGLTENPGQRRRYAREWWGGL